MATQRPQPKGQKEVYPNGKPPALPTRYDVVSGPAPMRTTPAFKNPFLSVPQLGLHLGFNK